jgi:hypothetical protein
MQKIEFGQFLNGEEVYKVCPECRFDIKPEYTHAYDNEWCPACGLNHEVVFKKF